MVSGTYRERREIFLIFLLIYIRLHLIFRIFWLFLSVTNNTVMGQAMIWNAIFRTYIRGQRRIIIRRRWWRILIFICCFVFILLCFLLYFLLSCFRCWFLISFMLHFRLVNISNIIYRFDFRINLKIQIMADIIIQVGLWLWNIIDCWSWGEVQGSLRHELLL